MVAGPDPLADQNLREGPSAEHVDGDAGLSDVGDGLDVGVGLRVPHDHLRVDLQRGHHRDQRGLIPVFDLLIGGRVSEVDGVVGDHPLGRGREADGRAAGSHFPIDAQVLAVQRHRPPHDLVLGVDDVVVAQQLVHGAVLRLGEPVGLDHQRVGAHPGQIRARGAGGIGGGLRGGRRGGGRSRGGRGRGRRGAGLGLAVASSKHGRGREADHPREADGHRDAAQQQNRSVHAVAGFPVRFTPGLLSRGPRRGRRPTRSPAPGCRRGRTRCR